ncbi:ATP-dependent Clp protease proteolytic subunit [Consotaella aegiceratis]|uniref:ATP-dependent Clp protease proteolytic subunit n=1 Tax=Consotaella aegiceratis TaxID=3097961 RepID=UPI002F3F7F19
MIGSEIAPGRPERLFQALPEGLILRGVFYTLLGLAVAIVALDYRDMARAQADQERIARTEPLPLDRPQPGDQIRPYLPKTIPVGPDRGEPSLPGYDGPVDGTAMAEPMQFILAEDGAATLIGRIDVGTAEAFRAFLDDHQDDVASLHIHSPGGSVVDAIAMARLVREKGLDTVVPDDGYCASACPLLFAGGVARSAGTDSWIGVHQVYALSPSGAEPAPDVGRSISEVQGTIAECQQLLLDMGVKPDLWIKAMLTPPEALYVLTEDELHDYGLVTDGAGGKAAPAA